MSFSWWFRYLFFTLSYLKIVRTVPPEYCLSPLNRSDCNMAPKTVFSYYKPGSRCEMETWRGCPTANKFDNEYLCSLNCIFRTRPDNQFNPCTVPINQSICGEQKVIFTSVDGRCVSGYWGSCPTYNMFETGEECQQACGGEIVAFELPLPYYHDPLEEINELLKHIIEEDVTTTRTQETETEAVIESTTEAVIESTTEAVTESTTEAVTESTTEAVTEFTTDDVTETTTEAVTESITEVVTTTTTEVMEYEVDHVLNP